MRGRKVIVPIVASLLLGGMAAVSALQAPAVRSVDEKVLREYTGVYQWQEDAFLYLQMWSEFTGKNQLVAFDESGEVRTLYPTDDGRSSPAPAQRSRLRSKSRVEFQRDGNGKITSLTWWRDGADPRRPARRD